jgi:hypothetical protein
MRVLYAVISECGVIAWRKNNLCRKPWVESRDCDAYCANQIIPLPLLPGEKGSNMQYYNILAPLPKERGWGEVNQ